jgi:Xaa-Pro aminopeptidase
MSNLIKLTKLRNLLAEQELDGWLVPRSDEHQGEYVAPYAERLAWVSGFDGSAGMAIILKDKAAVFVDGRYTLQAKNQVDGSLFEIVPTADVSPGQWLAQNAAGLTIGFDPWLHTESEIQRYEQASHGLGIELAAMEGNLIDDAWDDQPGMPEAPAVVHDERYAGESSASKRKKLVDTMKARNIDAAMVTNLDAIAWLLNIRGTDIPCTPVVLSFAILHADASVDFFVDALKLDSHVEQHLGSDVRIHGYHEFLNFTDGLNGKRVLCDPKTAPIQVRANMESVGAEVVRGDDICLLPKACKNETELNGMRNAHMRDGAALSEFIVWLTNQLKTQKVTELEASDKLRTFRERKDLFKGLSFDTISGAGPNGAIVHYRVTPQSSRTIDPAEIYLLDSGGQYLDGTTDVTRTLAFNGPTAEQKDRFTRVLKGHIAVATAVFPKGTTGAQLDTLARRPLWDVGLDYQHGTGHGVGCYLCVHEGPQRIAKGMALDAPLRAGMVISNEPGYYKEGEYGIRIESLVIVKDFKDGFLCFETITLTPICRALIDVSLLTESEKAWLNAYHARVRETLPKFVHADMANEVNTWLAEQTAAI